MDMAMPHNNWWPRPHQFELWNYLVNQNGKRAMAVWHRRAGKDEVCLHVTALAMLQRPGNYWHCLPEYAQARKSIWDAVNPHTGKRRIDEAFPPELIANKRDHDMTLRFHNGSTFSCIGSDSYDRVVGSSAAGVVFSEYALSNPSSWAYIRPMLEENDGWAVFITTPRGRNHAFEMAKHAALTPHWFYQLQSARDTEALTEEQLDEALAEYRALYGYEQGEALYRQEYLCDWQSALLGSFYADFMAQIRKEGRILECEPIDTDYVHRAWDLGVGDDTSIWWFQAQPSGQLLILDHYAASGRGVEHFRDEIFHRHEQRGWRHGSDFVPHDANVREWGTGRSRIETMQSIGLKPMRVPMASLDDGINAVRRTLPLCVFHPRTENGGISALEQYRREWDDEAKCFKKTAVHDWTSHPADSFRYLAQAWRSAPRRAIAEPRREGWTIPPPREQRQGGIRL